MDRHTREEIEMIIDEKNREYFANKKKKAKDNYEKNRDIYGMYKDKPEYLINLLKTVQDIRQITDCGKLANELFNIKIKSKKNRGPKKCRMFVEKLNEIVNPKIIITKVVSKNTIYDIVLEKWALEKYSKKYNIIDLIWRPSDYNKQLGDLVSSILEKYKPVGYYHIFWDIRQVFGIEEVGDKLIKIKIQIN